MPFIQITIAQGHDATTKRALVTQVSAAAAAATGTPEAAFRVWIVEVDPNEVSVGGTVLADQRQGEGGQRR
jgi:4-oxalocrotonate tautomerase family enzyme